MSSCQARRAGRWGKRGNERCLPPPHRQFGNPAHAWPGFKWDGSEWESEQMPWMSACKQGGTRKRTANRAAGTVPRDVLVSLGAAPSRRPDLLPRNIYSKDYWCWYTFWDWLKCPHELSCNYGCRRVLSKLLNEKAASFTISTPDLFQQNFTWFIVLMARLSLDFILLRIFLCLFRFIPWKEVFKDPVTIKEILTTPWNIQQPQNTDLIIWPQEFSVHLKSIT